MTLTAASLLANDTDVDAGDTKTLVSVDGTGAVGSVSIVGGNVVYDPGLAFQSLGAGATTTDSFTYTMQDAAGVQSTATVTMTITGVNDGPDRRRRHRQRAGGRRCRDPDGGQPAGQRHRCGCRRHQDAGLGRRHRRGGVGQHRRRQRGLRSGPGLPEPGRRRHDDRQLHLHDAGRGRGAEHRDRHHDHHRGE